MNKSQGTIFDGRRFLLLLKNMLLSQSSPLLLYAGAFGGLLLLVTFLRSHENSASNFHDIFFRYLLFLGGFLLSSNAFNELDKQHSRMSWLLLPCSIFEKHIVKLLITSLVYAVASLLFYSLLSYTAEGIYYLVYEARHPFFDPFSQNILYSLGVYLVLQSFFFTGAIYFRRFVFIKTVLSLMTICFILFVLVMLTMRFFFMDSMPHGRMSFQFHFDGNSMQNFQGTLAWVFGTLKFIFWGCIAPFFWWLSYRRLRKIEA